MKKLNQYRGFLTSEQIVAGITAAKKNAARLAEDAEILLKIGRYPSACSLAVLSLEESGKTTILRNMATAIEQKDILDLWKSYRRHLDKHILTLLPDRAAKGARLLREFRDCVTDATLDEKAAYDAVKQIGFYTDCLDNAHWSIPSIVVDEELARSIVTNAKIASSGSHTVTVREIELWIIHMQAGYTRQNLVAWAKAMEGEKLQPEGYAEEMANFSKGL